MAGLSRFEIDTEADRAASSLSMPTSLSTSDIQKFNEKAERDREIEKKQVEAGVDIAFAAAQFGVSMFNAQSKYNEIAGAAQFNIMQARNQAQDAISRGRQAAFARQSEGIKAGEQSLLAMAAQGQDVQGAAAQKIQASYEAMGLENAMREEINSVREALGFQLEEVEQEYARKLAKSQRDISMISAGIQFAASGAKAYYGSL